MKTTRSFFNSKALASFHRKIRNYLLVNFRNSLNLWKKKWKKKNSLRSSVRVKFNKKKSILWKTLEIYFPPSR